MRNIYDLLNDVETSLDDYDVKPLTDLESRKLQKAAARIAKKPKQKGRWLGAACAAALAIGVMLMAPADSPVYAAKEHAAYQISQLLGLDRDLQEYASMPGTCVTDSGYTIQLNEVILDRDTLLIATTVYQDGEELPMAIPSGDVYINGRDAASVASGSAEKGLQGAVTAFHIKDSVNTSGQLDIKLVYHNISLQSDSPAGRWVFHFTADGSNLAADTQVIPLDYRLMLEHDAELRLNRYIGNLIGQRIEYSMRGNVNRDIKLEGTDDKGQPIVFFSSVYENNWIGTEGHGYLQNDSSLGSAITEETKWLSLTPYLGETIRDENDRYFNQYDDAGEPFIIFLQQP